MNILLNILKDPATHIGSAGVFLMTIASYIAEHVSGAFGIAAGGLGIIISTLIIVEKVRQNKILSIEIEIKKRQLLDLEEEE